jgi:hypothetical protein
MARYYINPGNHMSRLAEYRALEQKLAAQLAELESMKNDEGLKREVEFEQKLRELLGDYSYSLKHIIAILDPQAAQHASTGSKKTTRKARMVKRYRHPDTGEVVETKGGNHKTLKAWKQEHGSEMVEAWVE